MIFVKSKPGKPPTFRKQNGISLFVTLVALVAMALTGVALIRAVDTTNQISGNYAFRNAALHAADAGIENAFAQLQTITSGQLDAKQPSGCTDYCYYYPTMQLTDANGIPTPYASGFSGATTTLNWAGVTGDPVTVNNDYTAVYVIDRLCTGTPPITNLTANCYAGTTIGGGTKKSGGIIFSSTNQLYFRVTVRVAGPRNTYSYVQSIIAH